MTAYVANHQKKKRILLKRENELKHALKHGFSSEKQIQIAEKLRLARLAIFKSDYSRLSILPAHTYKPDEEALKWITMPIDEIIKIYQDEWSKP